MKLVAFLIAMLLTWQQMMSQAARYINELPKESWSGIEKGVQLSYTERQNLLKLLHPGERIEFEMNDGLSDDEEAYWPMDTAGLVFIDLDFDNDLDVLYSSQNAPMMQTATKVFYNLGTKLEHAFTLADGILDIEKRKNELFVYTFFNPCCDSYTSRIEVYHFSETERGTFMQSISFIGRSHYPLSGMPDFDACNSFYADSLSLLALQSDFRGTHPYFRKRSNEVRTSLRENGKIELLKLTGNIEFRILASESIKGEFYDLIITEPLNNVPSMPVSLYEWSDGDMRRLIAWIQKKK